ncbi:MAG: hypothetical protein ACTSVZ_04680 [Promethearchaeota archaeon]
MTQNIITLAVGVLDDEGLFPNDHFGESKKFLIYQYDISSRKLNLLKSVTNTSPEEQMHGDPVKARGISSIIGDVDCILGHVVGKNVLRMRKKYVIILSPLFDVKTALSLFPLYIDRILEEKAKSGESRKIVHLKD